MKRISTGLSIGLLISVLTCGNAFAQATAQISGTVKDQTGAVLPGVEVTATQTDTGVPRSAVTNETGSYVLSNLALGPYRLEAALPGFRTFVQTGIVLQVNSSPVINPVLQVGQVSEQVEVQANAALVDTRNSSVGQVIENQRILELPLNGRDVTQLITLSGAAVSLGGEAGASGGASGGARNAGGGSAAYQVAGGLAYGVGFSLDGAPHVNTLSASSILMPFPDALQEFKVETGSGAQQGMAAGVSAVTKSGTNDLHGDLFEFVRNDLFNARNYFAIKGSTLKRNQFGGTIGGPIKNDKLFFFAGYQGTTVRQDPADVEAFIPTAAMLAGDWTAFAAPACNAGRPLLLRAPFVNNRIDPAQFSKPGLNVANRVSQTPRPLNECGLIRFGRPSRTDNWQTAGRIDFQKSANHSMFGRYFAFHSREPSGKELSPDNVLNATTGNSVLQQAFALGDTFLIGPNTVNAFRFSATRLAGSHLGSPIFNACDVGVNVYCGYAPTRMVLMISSGFTFPGNFTTGDRAGESNFVLNDDVSLVRGTHQIALGANIKWAQSIVHTSFIAANRFVFNGSVTGHGLGDLLTGRLGQLTAGGPYYIHMKQWSAAGYATDIWKATSKLTLNYGVRWEPFFPQNLVSGQGANFSLDRFRQGVKSTVYPNAPAGWYYQGDSGYPGQSGANIKWWNLAPRVGLAWDVTGNGRTSIRASYGLAYNLVGAHWHEDHTQNSPFAYGTAIANPPGGFDNPWQGYPGGNPFPIIKGVSPFTQYGDLTTAPYDIQTPRSSSFNLSLQRQVGSDWLASAAYMGNLSYHIWIQNDINPGIYIPGGPCTLNGVPYNPCSQASNTNQRRRFSLERPQDGQFMGHVAALDDGATMNYHGMLLSLQRRVTNGVSVTGNYTWSHCIGDKVDLTSSGPDSGETNTQPDNRKFDRGDCNGDRRQLFNMTAVAQTPQFANNKLRMIATGWTLSGIYRRNSGAPLDVIAGSDRALNGVQGFINNTQYQRGNQLSDKPYADQSGRPFTNWLDRNAFSIPDPGTYGNYRRNSVVGPPTWSFDVALSRAFRFREAQRMEFRAEAFNVMNSFRPDIPNSTLTSAQFGQLRTSFDPRILQFALKYVF